VSYTLYLNKSPHIVNLKQAQASFLSWYQVIRREFSLSGTVCEQSVVKY
jgi:hypothetical protein